MSCDRGLSVIDTYPIFYSCSTLSDTLLAPPDPRLFPLATPPSMSKVHFELEDSRMMVIDRQTAAEAEASILARYRIPSLASADLLTQEPWSLQ